MTACPPLVTGPDRLRQRSRRPTLQVPDCVCGSSVASLLLPWCRTAPFDLPRRTYATRLATDASRFTGSRPNG